MVQTMPSRFDVMSYRRWVNLRAWFADQMPLPCWRCGKLIDEQTEWDLGHRVDLALGGHDYDAWPEHRYAIAGVCPGNRAMGSQVRARQIAASREW